MIIIRRRNKNFTDMGDGGAVSSLPKTNMSSAKVAQEVGVDPSLMSKAKMEASKNGVMMKV